MNRAGCTLLCVLALIALPVHVEAQKGRRKVEEGNRYYAEEKYDSARTKYLEALTEVPNSPLVRFNEASALYQSRAYDKALEGFAAAAAAGDSSVQSQAWYNMGNSLYRAQQLQESVEAYKQALRIDPHDWDAKHNLEFVLQKLQQQQQQQQQQQPQDQDQQDQEDQQSPGQQNQNQEQQQDSEQRPQASEQPQDQPPPPDEPEQNQSEANQPGQQQQTESPEEVSRQPQMSREELERLLQAIQEDPEQIQRKLRASRRPVRVKKDW